MSTMIEKDKSVGGSRITDLMCSYSLSLSLSLSIKFQAKN